MVNNMVTEVYKRSTKIAHLNNGQSLKLDGSNLLDFFNPGNRTTLTINDEGLEASYDYYDKRLNQHERDIVSNGSITVGGIEIVHYTPYKDPNHMLLPRPRPNRHHR